MVQERPIPTPPARSTRIPTTEPCPKIVALLLDTDFKKRSDTGTWSHRDGSAFTLEEQAAVFATTDADLREVDTYIARYRAYRHANVEAREALYSFLNQFTDQLVEQGLGNVIKHMTEADRAELERLACAIDNPDLPSAPGTS